jgi:hypothetical protein
VVPPGTGTFAETEVVYGGWQSMPLAYDNTAFPFYSETRLPLDTGLRDWTIEGIDRLRLYVRGQAENHPDRLYVLLQDANGNEAVAYNSDEGIARTEEWTEWEIPLSGFEGVVDLTNIEALSIGLGERSNAVEIAIFSAGALQGGTGTIYVDCISLLGPSWPVGFSGFVRDNASKLAIPNTKNIKVVFTRDDGQKRHNALGNPKDGQYYVSVPCNHKYHVDVSADGYEPHDFDFDISVAGVLTWYDRSQLEITPPPFCGPVGLNVYLIKQKSSP